ncbi:MAG: methylated-DNA--[Eggerthellaceae bacterium]|nr:methylated-DNA--[protein]-cysteine S-methyltransferase [Eggerthellaceae bacterium]
MPGENRACELSNLCATQLLEYFAGRRTAFDLPLKPQGSEFQIKVWDALQRIPYGQTRTTAEIADAIGCPESFRMVGIAIRKNPIIILIPAHRVVGANGKVPGTDKQAQRRAAFLELERRFA